MSFNISPEMGKTTGAKPFKFWCQKVLPLVYDDSLSYYELLCKVVSYINGLLSDISVTNENVSKMYEAFSALEHSVEDYFNTTDFIGKIDESINRLVEEGVLDEVFAKYLNELVDKAVVEVKGYADDYFNSEEFNHKFEDAVDALVERGVLDDIIARLLTSVWYPVDSGMSQAEIQQAINTYPAIKFTSGDYHVSVLANYDSGFTIPSNRTIWFDNANIILDATNCAAYQVVNIDQAESVNIFGSGTIRGDRDNHLGDGGEWGMCLCISGSNSVNVSGLNLADGWGDGIYIINSQNVCVDGVQCNRARRNGISIISGEDITIIDCVFEDTNGTAPQASLAVEANTSDDTTKNIRFIRCAGKRSVGAGFYATTRASNSSVYFIDCEVDNGMGLSSLSGDNSHFEVINCKWVGTANGCVNTDLSGTNDSIVIRDCVCDSNGAVTLIQQANNLQNCYIDNLRVNNGRFGRQVLWRGNRDSCKNNTWHFVLSDCTFSELNTNTFYGDEFSCSLKVDVIGAYVHNLTGICTMFYPDNIITVGSEGAVATHLYSVVPGATYKILNNSGVSVKVKFPGNVPSLNGGDLIDVPNGRILMIEGHRAGYPAVWLA